MKGNIALKIGPMTLAVRRVGMTSYYSTTQFYNQQPILQPLHHQPISLTYGGDRAMDDTGGDRHETLVRIRPKKVIVKRSIGQEEKKNSKLSSPPGNSC